VQFVQNDWAMDKQEAWVMKGDGQEQFFWSPVCDPSGCSGRRLDQAAVLETTFGIISSVKEVMKAWAAGCDDAMTACRP